MIALIFDVETTGLVKKDQPDPFIIQLSYILFDLKTLNVIEVFDKYIKIDESIKIPWTVINVTGITQSRCKTGIPIQDALVSFDNAMSKCNFLIAHNYNFDSKMINIELNRCFQNGALDSTKIINKDLSNFNSFCTMINSTEICKIKSIYKENEYKWPTLAELHNHLFGYVPNGLHDSLTDIKTCLKCYLKIKNNINVDFGTFNHKCYIE